MIRFSFNIGCSESKVVFKRKKKKQTCQIKMLYREQTFAPRAFHSYFQNSSNKQTQSRTVHTQKSPPWACNKGCAEACAERFSALKLFDCTILSCSSESYYFLPNSEVLFSNSIMSLWIPLFSFQFYYSLSNYVLRNPGLRFFGRRHPGDQ